MYLICIQHTTHFIHIKTRTPFLLSEGEWLQENGPRFLVRGDIEQAIRTHIRSWEVNVWIEVDNIWWMSLSQVSLEIAWMNFGFTWLLAIGSLNRRLQRQKLCAHRNVTMQWTVRWKSPKPRRVPLWVWAKLSRFWHSHNSPLPTCKRLSKRKKLLQKKPKDASDLDDRATGGASFKPVIQQSHQA